MCLYTKFVWSIFSDNPYYRRYLCYIQHWFVRVSWKDKYRVIYSGQYPGKSMETEMNSSGVCVITAYVEVSLGSLLGQLAPGQESECKQKKSKIGAGLDRCQTLIRVSYQIWRQSDTFTGENRTYTRHTEHNHRTRCRCLVPSSI